ncbi:trypsin-like isoform X2 [Harmonia axyridis]|uniref:trypsin-like isoform X2 n=1 Tax=Harmonia axyridis TaxID=115357 RepID=UPI001E277B17|nr:trypsin-like isoform X2 [Harmonia axyridis]
MFSTEIFLYLIILVSVSRNEENSTIKINEISNNTTTTMNTTTLEMEQKGSDATTTTQNSTSIENEQDTTMKTQLKTKNAVLMEIQKHTKSVEIVDHPYLVSIMRDMIHTCCGTIITNFWVLTAAHCLALPGPTLFIPDVTTFAVVAGQSQLGLGKMQLRRAKNLYLHNSFVKKMLINDIGMILLYEPFELNEYVNVVPLSSSISKPYKFFSYCSVVSWTVYRKDFLNFDKLKAEEEKTKKMFKVPELQMTKLPTINIDECFERIGVKEFLTGTHICTEYGTFKNISCATDSGGPLICGDRQYGIFSWESGSTMSKQTLMSTFQETRE